MRGFQTSEGCRQLSLISVNSVSNLTAGQLSSSQVCVLSANRSHHSAEDCFWEKLHSVTLLCSCEMCTTGYECHMDHLIDIPSYWVQNIYSTCLHARLSRSIFSSCKGKRNSILCVRKESVFSVTHQSERLVIHDACKSCETCSLVTGLGGDLLSHFQAKLFYQSGPYWTVPSCSLVRRNTKCISFCRWGTKVIGSGTW